MRDSLLRLAFSVLLAALILGSAPASAQNSSSSAGSAPPPATSAPESATTATATSQPVPAEIAAAESAIAASDWKTAEAKLDVYLASHPADARALFDAGYVADAQNRLDDAAVLYRRAVAADPNSFEAHISLGLLLARQDKLAEARPELARRHHSRSRCCRPRAQSPCLARTRPHRSRHQSRCRIQRSARSPEAHAGNSRGYAPCRRACRKKRPARSRRGRLSPGPRQGPQFRGCLCRPGSSAHRAQGLCRCRDPSARCAS